MGETLASAELTAEDVALWKERGYHIHGKLFTDEQVASIRAACEAVLQGDYEAGVPPDDIYWRPGDNPEAMRKIDNAWKANAVIREAVTSPKLGQIAAQLLDAPSIRLWHDQISFKPGGGGKVVTWHQDWAYWQMIDVCETVTCWISLADVDPKAGPMIYLAGSHKLGLYERPSSISGDDEQKPALPDGAALEEVEVVIPAGHVAFHHGLLLHGSGRNYTSSERPALVSHVMSGACTYQERNEHVNERAMKAYDDYPQTGEAFHGPQFPQLWPEG